MAKVATEDGFQVKTGCCVGGTCYGPILIPAPPDEGDLQKHVLSQGLKYVRSTTGKIVEYNVVGSQAPDAKIFVTVYCAMPLSCYSQECKTAWQTLNIKEINISMPAVGYSEASPGQPIAHWPRECLAPVLEAEKVDKFGVHGNSVGTQFAMAIANEYVESGRCVVLGLRAAFVNLPLSKELKFPKGQDVFHTNKDISRGTCKGWMMKKMFKSVVPMFKDYNKDEQTFDKVCKKMSPNFFKDHKDCCQMCTHMTARLFTAHYRELAMALYAASDQVLDNPTANVDPRELAKKMPGDRITVWYCEKDEDVPSCHTKWLAGSQCLQAKKTRIVDGYGHQGACALFIEEFYKELLEMWPEQ